MDELLAKSIDSLIDSIFAEESPALNKAASILVPDAKTTADAAMAQVPKSENDANRGAGRPNQISDVPNVDTDGARSGEYDKDIASKNEDAKKKEDSQVAPPADMRKSLSDAEFTEYQALKKAKEEAAKEEALTKARKEHSDLIKSAVVEATSDLRKENEELRKSFARQSEMIEAIANKPQRAKAVTNVQAVEKFQKSQNSEVLTKSELLDVAEELMKSGKLTLEQVVEFENTGSMFDPNARRALEAAVAKR